MTKINLNALIFSPVPRNVAIVAEVAAIVAIAVGLITLFALNGYHLGPFNSFSHLGKVGEIAFFSSGAAVAFVATCLLLVRAIVQCLEQKKQKAVVTVIPPLPLGETFPPMTPSKASDVAVVTPTTVTPPKDAVVTTSAVITPPTVPDVTTPATVTSPKVSVVATPTPVTPVDAVFKPNFAVESRVLTQVELGDKLIEELKPFPITVPVLPLKKITHEQKARADKTKKELGEKHHITQPDGRNWDFDTVLFRGVRLPDPTHDKLEVASSDSMTQLVAHTFAEGMYPNGYVHQVDGSPSKYYEELTFEEKAHNWLVSTTFGLGTACSYASGEVMGGF